MAEAEAGGKPGFSLTICRRRSARLLLVFHSEGSRHPVLLKWNPADVSKDPEYQPATPESGKQVILPSRFIDDHEWRDGHSLRTTSPWRFRHMRRKGFGVRRVEEVDTLNRHLAVARIAETHRAHRQLAIKRLVHLRQSNECRDRPKNEVTQGKRDEELSSAPCLLHFRSMSRCGAGEMKARLEVVAAPGLVGSFHLVATCAVKSFITDGSASSSNFEESVDTM